MLDGVDTQVQRPEESERCECGDYESRQNQDELSATHRPPRADSAAVCFRRGHAARLAHSHTLFKLRRRRVGKKIRHLGTSSPEGGGTGRVALCQNPAGDVGLSTGVDVERAETPGAGFCRFCCVVFRDTKSKTVTRVTMKPMVPNNHGMGWSPTCPSAFVSVTTAERGLGRASPATFVKFAIGGVSLTPSG